MEEAFVKTPLGIAKILGNEYGIASISVLDDNAHVVSETIPEVLEEAVFQLNEYFNGDRKEFSLPLHPEGSDFQQRVWLELQQIP